MDLNHNGTLCIFSKLLDKIMSKFVDKKLVDDFLDRLIRIEEEPIYMTGAQETERRKKIYQALLDTCEKNN